MIAVFVSNHVHCFLYNFIFHIFQNRVRNPKHYLTNSTFSLTVSRHVLFDSSCLRRYLAHVPSEIFIKLKRIYQSSSNHTYLFLCLISINVMFCHMVACDIESKVQFGSRQNIAVRSFNQIKALKKNSYSTFSLTN